MVSATEWTSVSPAIAEGFLLTAETTIRVGRYRYYDSLEVTSATYAAAYDYASVGLQAANAINLGLLEGISVELTSEFEDITATNVLTPGIKTLSAEGAVISFSSKQFDPDHIQFLLQNGVFYGVNEIERFITFGGACNTLSRPLEVSVVNLACQAPSSVSINNGLSGMVLTLYDGQFTSGLNWGDLTAQAFNSLENTYEAQPWLSRALGNRLGNMLFF